MRKMPAAIAALVALALAGFVVHLATPGAASAKKLRVATFSIPHFVISPGGSTSAPNSFDTTIHAVYNGGLAGTPDRGGAEIKLWLYDDFSSPLKTASGFAVCSPCTVAIGSSFRKTSISIGDFVESNGGFAHSGKTTGFGVMTVTGNDPTSVALQGFVVNSHTSAFDVSVFGFEPQELKGAVQ
jgi:hypothetical protein